MVLYLFFLFLASLFLAPFSSLHACQYNENIGVSETPVFAKDAHTNAQRDAHTSAQRDAHIDAHIDAPRDPRTNAHTDAFIDSLTGNGPASHAFWFLQVRDDAGSILQSLHADKVVRPASNLKMLTASAIVALLGPDYRFETPLLATGKQSGDRWVGDLHVIGSGDPSIHATKERDPLFLFESWVQKLDSMGVRRIDGNLIGWNGRFDNSPYPKGWEWDDLTYYYAPEIDALSFNMNVVDLVVSADGEPGGTPSITWSPIQTPYVQFINEQQISPVGTEFDESYLRLPGTNTIYLRSTLPPDYIETEPLTIHQPAYFFMDTMRRWFEERGIVVSGQTLVRSEPITGTLTDSDDERFFGGSYKVLSRYSSPPLIEMAGWLLRESDNFYTEMLVKALAAEKFQTQGSTELGLDLIREYLVEKGVDPVYLVLRDGSGMAPATMIRLSDLNLYLHNLKKEPWFNRFYEGLPVSGLNGTLKDRFHNSPVLNQFNGKTGFLTGVRTLSGYLVTERGSRLTITVAANNYTVKTREIDRIQEQILEYLYYHY